MSSDPYIQLLDSFTPKESGGSTSAAPVIGTVRSASPLKIDMGGITLDEDDLYVNAVLLPGYSRSMSFAGSSGTADWTNAGLKKGDQVALVPMADGQKYIALCVVEGGS